MATIIILVILFFFRSDCRSITYDSTHFRPCSFRFIVGVHNNNIRNFNGPRDIITTDKYVFRTDFNIVQFNFFFFFNYCLSSGREKGNRPAIARCFRELSYAENGYNVALFWTGVPLTKSILFLWGRVQKFSRRRISYDCMYLYIYI